jgi:hypothetical protein
MIKPPAGIFSGSTLLRSITAPGAVSSSALSASRTCSALLAGIALFRPKLVLDHRR